MPLLQLGALAVEITDATIQAPVRLGTSSPSAANTLRSTVRAADQRRGWKITARPMTPTEYAALVAAAPDGAYVSASGDLPGVASGAAILCEVSHGDAPFVHDGDAWQVQPSLSLVEVAPSGVTAPAVIP